jgi:hypothetical protein
MREDESVLREHLALLKAYPAFKKIYQVISESIIQYKKANDKLQGTA